MGKSIVPRRRAKAVRKVHRPSLAELHEISEAAAETTFALGQFTRHLELFRYATIGIVQDAVDLDVEPEGLVKFMRPLTDEGYDKLACEAHAITGKVHDVSRRLYRALGSPKEPYKPRGRKAVTA